MENKISVVIPAYNEEKNIAKVIKLVKNNKNVGQVIVVDNASTDNTSKIAIEMGAEVVECKDKGKGYAMERGLKEVKYDIVEFIDADINNYTKNLIDMLAEPILENEADFVKSNFDRQGGRITELVAKPLLKIVFPEMEYYSQPLSGMIAGKKEVFSNIEFEKDYGVDIGILLDVLKLGYKVKEVHIGKINNDSQPWNSLEKMSREVMTAILKRANYTK